MAFVLFFVMFEQLYVIVYKQADFLKIKLVIYIKMIFRISVNNVI